MNVTFMEMIVMKPVYHNVGMRRTDIILKHANGILFKDFSPRRSVFHGIIDQMTDDYLQNIKEIEKDLKEQLEECLSSHNAEDCIKHVEYFPGTRTLSVEFRVHVVEEDNYIGLGEY